MTRSLDDRLQDAKSKLDQASTLLNVNAGVASPGDQLRRSLATATSIAHWRELLTARTAARELLTGLEDRIEPDDFVLVQYGRPRRVAQPMRIKYSHARLIAVEAYLSLTWSLADHVSAFVGRVLCSSDGGAFNAQQSPKLVSHFVNAKDSLRQSTAGLVFDSIRQTFGWPIGISYALRNHFVHDGGQQQEVAFFAGGDSTDKFKILPDGWRHVRNRALSYEVVPENMRKSANWPATPEDDLRIVLDVCEREVDEALGVLVGSASAAIMTHVMFLTDNDP
jgi:hypothetical protein